MNGTLYDILLFIVIIKKEHLKKTTLMSLIYKFFKAYACSAGLCYHLCSALNLHYQIVLWVEDVKTICCPWCNTSLIKYIFPLCVAIWLHLQNKGTMERECYQTAGEISSLDSFLIRRLSTILLKSVEGWKPHDFITPIQSWQSKCLVNCLLCQHRSWFTTSLCAALLSEPVSAQRVRRGG